MAEILIFSGTTEGRELAEALCARQIDCMASVATEYGREVMRQQEHLVIREGADGRTGDGRTHANRCISC